MALNQAYLFLIFSLNGLIIGLILDFFRILRISFKTNNYITYIEDFLFWIITGISIIFFMYKFSDGNLRSYIFLGIVLGFILYLLIFSKIIIKVFVEFLDIIKKIIHIIIRLFTIPIKNLYKILNRFILNPICSLFQKINVFVTKKHKKNNIKLKILKNFEKKVKK